MNVLDEIYNFLLDLRKSGLYARCMGDVLLFFLNNNHVFSKKPIIKFNFNGIGLVSVDLVIKNLKHISYIKESFKDHYIAVLPVKQNIFCIYVFDGFKKVYECKIKIFDRIVNDNKHFR